MNVDMGSTEVGACYREHNEIWLDRKMAFSHILLFLRNQRWRFTAGKGSPSEDLQYVSVVWCNLDRFRLLFWSLDSCGILSIEHIFNIHKFTKIDLVMSSAPQMVFSSRMNILIWKPAKLTVVRRYNDTFRLLPSAVHSSDIECTQYFQVSTKTYLVNFYITLSQFSKSTTILIWRPSICDSSFGR